MNKNVKKDDSCNGSKYSQGLGLNPYRVSTASQKGSQLRIYKDPLQPVMRLIM